MRFVVLSFMCLFSAACVEAEALDSFASPKATAHVAGPPEIERPYDADADAQAQIDAAVVSAAEDGRRVLVVFGANWCEWCRRLDWVFQNQRQVSDALEAGYHLVHVDVGPRRSSTNRAVAARYGDPISRGLPCLVVLDGDGEVAHVQETASLEAGDRHDPALVLAFLERWRNAS